MRTNNVLSIFLLILVPLCFGAKFSADSFTALGQDLNTEEYFLKEYTIDGTELQTIALSDNLPTLSRGARADSTGALISFVVHNGVFNNYISKAYTLNLMGETVSTTSLPGNAAIASDVIVDGQDVWFTTIGVTVPYTTRGSNGVPVTANIFPGNVTPRDTIQLVGTRLYTNVGLKIHYMDPISTTVSTLSVLSTATTDSITFFYFHSSSVAYAITSGSTPALIRFDVTSNSATEAYRYNITTLNTDSSVINCYSMDVGGYRYVFVAQQSYPFSRITSYVDDGTTFRDENSLFTLPGPTFIFAVGASPKPTCSDDMKNQDETDIDCGGNTCDKCTDGKACLSSSDCFSDYCNNALMCIIPTCDDNVKNQDEADVDCGGITCTFCADGRMCLVGSDCSSGYCDANNKCATPTCSDNVKNQDETDVDCGGTLCSVCTAGNSCSINSDCDSNVCTGNECVAPIADTPQSSSPSSTQSPLKPVSASNNVVCYSVIVLLAGFMAFI